MFQAAQKLRPAVIAGTRIFECCSSTGHHAIKVLSRRVLLFLYEVSGSRWCIFQVQ
jgi:hypothetical protein